MAAIDARSDAKSVAFPESAAATLACHACFFCALSSMRPMIASHLPCSAVICAGVSPTAAPRVAILLLNVVHQVFRASSPGGMKSAI
jgi:hypothetical protein